MDCLDHCHCRYDINISHGNIFIDIYSRLDYISIKGIFFSVFLRLSYLVSFVILENTVGISCIMQAEIFF